MDELRFEIEFYEHVTFAYRESIKEELWGMGASVVSVNEDVFLITSKNTNAQYVCEFLRAEDSRGTLKISDDIDYSNF
jgi:hypothetical protein